jgi:cytochrome c553
MTIRRVGLGAVFAFVVTAFAGSAEAQLRDITQIAPTVPGGAINKSFLQQIGAGRGDQFTPNTSIFIIRRDPFRAIRRGRQIFQRKFQVAQGFGPTTNDGVGNPSFVGGDPSITAGLADSCAACHGRPRGSAGFGGDVVTRPDSRDAPHLFGLGLQEQLADEMTTALRAIRAEAQNQAVANEMAVTMPLVAKGVNFGTITANPNLTFNTSGVVGVDPDLRVRPFFAHGGTISIREFLVGAFNAEMGLEGFDQDLITAANGADVTTPSGMVLSGSIDDIEIAPVGGATEDGDLDEAVDEIPESIADFEEFYLLHYFKAATQVTPTNSAAVTMGRATFTAIGCTSCHRATLTINNDRRIADLETNFSDFNPMMPATSGNPFNRMFANAATFFVEVTDVPGTIPDGGIGADGGMGMPGLPTLKNRVAHSFVVRNFFADFKRHDLGLNFHERNYEGTLTALFITEPLWGVGTTAPYGHDGRSDTLEDVILRHGGEGSMARDAFAALSPTAKSFVIDFLQSLVLFPPDDTASVLQPINPAAPNFPQNGHGAIALTPLFNNTADLE